MMTMQREQIFLAARADTGLPAVAIDDDGEVDEVPVEIDVWPLSLASDPADAFSAVPVGDGWGWFSPFISSTGIRRNHCRGC